MSHEAPEKVLDRIWGLLVMGHAVHIVCSGFQDHYSFLESIGCTGACCQCEGCPTGVAPPPRKFEITFYPGTPRWAVKQDLGTLLQNHELLPDGPWGDPVKWVIRRAGKTHRGVRGEFSRKFGASLAPEK